MSSPHIILCICRCAPCRPHRESNPGPSPECAAAFTTRPPRPILLRLTPTEHLWYGDNNTLVRANKMHDIYFTLSRIAAIIGFTMFRRGVCAAPRNAFLYFPYILFSCIFGSGTAPQLVPEAAEENGASILTVRSPSLVSPRPVPNRCPSSQSVP